MSDQATSCWLLRSVDFQFVFILFGPIALRFFPKRKIVLHRSTSSLAPTLSLLLFLYTLISNFHLVSMHRHRHRHHCRRRLRRTETICHLSDSVSFHSIFSHICFGTFHLHVYASLCERTLSVFLLICEQWILECSKISIVQNNKRMKHHQFNEQKWNEHEIKNKKYRWEQKWVMYTQREDESKPSSWREKNGQKQATFRKNTNKKERMKKNPKKYHWT